MAYAHSDLLQSGIVHRIPYSQTVGQLSAINFRAAQH